VRLALITLVSVVAVCAAVSFTSTAGASTKKLWHLPYLDPIASEIAGFPLAVDTSDNLAEWNAILGNPPYEVSGFTSIMALPGSLIYDPYDGYLYPLYHTIWMSPSVYTTFHSIGTTGINTTTDPNAVAIALLTLDHESQHQRLYSRDEGRVNACALKDLPRLLSTRFNVPETTQGTVLAATTTQVRTRYRVRVRVNVGGHWVNRYRYRFRYVTKTSYVPTVQTVPNPVYWTVLAAARNVYTNQPPPYNTGTCW
jgi:hypothetical protein